MAEHDLKAALKQAAERYWQVTIDMSGAEDGFMHAFRGDSNCPHRGLYDPESGHGFEFLDDVPFEDLEELVRVITALPPPGTPPEAVGLKHGG